MHGFEYKVVPAPSRGLKGRGIKGTPARFAHALELLMNELGAQGWEYQRSDTLPVEERQGLTGKTTSFQNMLVFRRALSSEATAATAPVAALIEDQTERADETPDEGPAETDLLDDAPTAEDTLSADVDEASSTGASEAPQNPPFTFPWARRAGTTAGTKSDNAPDAETPKPPSAP